MKSLMNRKLIVTILSLTVLLAACEGPVGPAGPAGAQGPAGADGANGADGAPGQNGAGFDEAIAYGSITVTYSGTLPVDEVPFEQTVEYPYSAAQSLISNTSAEGDERYFEIARWYSLPSAYEPQDNYVYFDLYVNEAAEPDTVTSSYIGINSRIIEGTKFFLLFSEYGFDSSEGFTDISFNPETGELSFHFEFVIPADYNSSGFDVTVSGDAEVIVKEQLETEEGPCTEC